MDVVVGRLGIARSRDERILARTRHVDLVGLVEAPAPDLVRGGVVLGAPRVARSLRDRSPEMTSRHANRDRERGRRVLFVGDPYYAPIDCRIRGSDLRGAFERRGWTVDLADVRYVRGDNRRRETEIALHAGGFDVVCFNATRSYRLIREIRRLSSAVLAFNLADPIWTPYFRDTGGWSDVDRILSEMDAIVCTTKYGVQYASRYGKHRALVPECVNVNAFDAVLRTAPQRAAGTIVIGWVGLETTVRAIWKIAAVLDELGQRHPGLELRLVGVRCASVLPTFSHLRCTTMGAPYSELEMLQELVAMDIGIYPPPLDLENYQARGPFKALNYMAARLPVVCQRAGEIAEIIADGETGMLADSPAEWKTKLESLIVDAELRRRIGQAGAAIVRERFSTDIVHDRFVAEIQRAVEQIPVRRDPWRPGRRRIARIRTATEPWRRVVRRAAVSSRSRAAGRAVRTVWRNASFRFGAWVDRGARPTILMLVDKPGWAFDHSARHIAGQLRTDFRFDIRYVHETPRLSPARYDLAYVFFWGEDYHHRFGFESRRTIKEVSSHRWEDDPRYGRCTPLEMRRRYLGDADTVVTTSSRLYALLAPHHSRTFHVPNGIDSAQFRRTRDRAGALTIGWAGNINDPVKGVRDILEPACGIQFTLKLASGTLPYRAMNDFYNGLDVFAVASAHEGEPLSLIEAMAAGCFPVCADVGIVPELIDDRRNGVIVRERTPEAFRDAFEWCEANLAVVRRAGTENALRIRAERDWRHCASRFREVFADTLRRL